MKKLFTTFLMMGVALCGWASYTADYVGTTLTINYVDDGNSNLNVEQLIPEHMRNAETLVLTGDWANKDLPDVGKLVGRLVKENGPGANPNKKVFLDLSACKNMACQATYTGEGDIDWTSNNFTFTYSYGDPVETNVEKKNGEWGYYTEYYYYPTSPNPNSWTTIDESLVTVDPSDPNKGTAMIKPSGSKFLLDNGNFNNNTNKLGGIAFPDHENFTAVPDQVFGQTGPADLTSATVGSNVVWIGEDAFKNTKLASFNFPAGLKVIGGEAFHKAPLDKVDLGGCTSLVAIKYEAFEEVSASDFTFPGKGNSLTFIGNDAFRKSGISSADMSNCTCITEFQNLNGSYRTFSDCTSLTSVSLPPNLREIPDDNGSGVFAGSTGLQSVTFNGVAQFGTDENGKPKLLNPFTIGKKAFKQFPLNSITFAENSNLTEIRESAFNGCTSLPAVNLKGKARYVDCELINPLIIEQDAFNGCTSLAELVLSNNVQSIAFQAFHSAAITEIHIPASVEYLAKHCFYNCQQLANVYFDAFDKTLGNCKGAETFIAGDDGAQGNGAFEECQHITDVYILTEAKLHCQNNAFDQDITWGAGSVEANFATLHYPKDNVENYVNLKHYLTDAIVGDPGLFHLWLHEHYDLAGVPNKNGWYEFINSGPFDPENEEECQSIILRTFSDNKLSYLVPNGLRAYVVSDIKLAGDNYEVTLTRIRVIPKQTGVILYGHPNGKTSDGKPTLVLTPVEFAPAGETIQLDGGQTVTAGENEGLPLCRANWDNNYVKNYLEPILSEDGSAVPIKPYEKVDGVVTFRNFGLGRYKDTDYFITTALTSDENNYVGFFRMKPESYKSGYAYLRLAPGEFDAADGGEILVKPDKEKNLDKGILSYSCEYRLTDGKAFDAALVVGEAANPKGWWNASATPVGFYWDEYSMSWGDRTKQFKNNAGAKYFGEFEDDTDGIVKLIVPADNISDGEYYTLQGVKVAHPTKGVYIHNGKKVVIK